MHTMNCTYRVKPQNIVPQNIVPQNIVPQNIVPFTCKFNPNAKEKSHSTREAKRSIFTQNLS
jgi:hypothetical protein